MSRTFNILSSCVISNNAVVKNGEQLFAADTGSLQAFLLQVYNHFEINYPKFYKMDSISKLGWLAAELLLKDAVINNMQPEDMAIVLQNANASLDTDIKYYDTVSNMASPALFVYTLPNIVIGEISIRNNFKGENAFFIFDEFNAGFLYTYVNNLLNTGKAKYCICGWVDVLGESYKAALCLAGITGNDAVLTAGNLQKIYNGGKV